MIEFVQGDIFDSPVDIRVNTVNCVGVMGAGVALAFKRRYPEMFKDYKRDCRSGLVRPGRMHVWKSLEGVWIINFPTKRDWKEPSRYEDIDAGLDDLRQYLDSVGPVTVALPALGCGNGGLDWARVSGMIREKLDGLNAHVYVFEPSASRRAGESIASTTDDERKFTEQLGYDLLQSKHLLGLKESKSVYVMGSSEALLRKWIAIFPSRNPGEREFHALKSIAIELQRLKAGIGVALVYGTKSSGEIAEIFSMQGISAVLLLPFGVLTRKTLGKKRAIAKSSAITIISMAAPAEEWSRQLVTESMNTLRLNAGAFLVSDPEPNWLSNRELSRWGHAPISYVKYEATSPVLRGILEGAGAKPIGRRGENGAPNIDFLLSTLLDVEKASVSPVDIAETDVVADFIEPEGEIDEKNAPRAQGEVLGLSVGEKSHDELLVLLEAILHVGVKEIAFKLPNSASEDDRRRLLALGFNRSER